MKPRVCDGVRVRSTSAMGSFRQGPGEDFARDPDANHQALKALNGQDDAHGVAGEEAAVVLIASNQDANERIRQDNRVNV
jgi:hypothetical protein